MCAHYGLSGNAPVYANAPVSADFAQWHTAQLIKVSCAVELLKLVTTVSHPAVAVAAATGSY